MISMSSDDPKDHVALVSTKRHRESLVLFTMFWTPLTIRRTANEDGGLHAPYGLRSIAGMTLPLVPLNQALSSAHGSFAGASECVPVVLVAQGRAM